MKEHILIVGAGIAGLTAARELRAHGLRVTVIEARERVGGRIWTSQSLGAPVDLGALLLHGVEHNPVTALCATLGLSLAPLDYTATALYDARGRSIKGRKVARTARIFLQWLEKALQEASRSPHDISMASAFAKVLTRQTASADKELITQWAIPSLSMMEGVSLERLSTRAFAGTWELEGGDYLVKEGMAALPQALAEGLPLSLGQTVRRIRRLPSCVQVDTQDRCFQGTRVLITLPLGVLKAKSVTFAPPLPAPKRQAIERLQMGNLNKVVLRFPRCFWPRHQHLLGDANDPPGTFPMLLNMTRTTEAPILVCVAGGDAADATETLSPTQLADQAMRFLRRCYGPNIPSPLEVQRTQWRADPFARGSYPYVPCGASLDDFATLAAPVEDRLFFAGDATHPHFPACMHGAILSARREAQRILALYT